MSIYAFDDEEKNIQINKPQLPSPWINYLSNGNLHAIISQAGGGFLWYKDAINCRISRYRMNHLPIDSPGFYIYIKNEDGNIWSPTFRPVEKKLDDWHAIHGAGETMFYAKYGEKEAYLKFYITPDYDVLVWDLDIRNNGEKTEDFDVFAYVELAQFSWHGDEESSYYWRHMLKTWFDEKTQSLMYMFHYPKNDYEKKNSPLVWFASDRKIESFSGDRDAFVGCYSYEKNPIAVENGVCGNDEIQSGNPCAALHIKESIEKGNKQKIKFYLGLTKGALLEFEKAKDETSELLQRFRKNDELDVQYSKLREWFNEYFGKFYCSIPDKNAERQINIWGPVNALQTALFSRSVNTLAPGVRHIGTRDSAQDMLAMCHSNANMAKDMLLYLLTKQFEDGSCTPLSSKRAGFVCNTKAIKSDAHLWLPLLSYLLAAESDTEFLDIKLPFLAKDGITEVGMATVWEHLLKAVEFTEAHLGRNGIPLTLRGDWNDIIGKFSEGGKGESVFAAQQYVVALDKLIKIANIIGDTETADRLTGYEEKQKRAILSCGWNGKWWYRCFKDDGTPVGCEDDEFGKIWINSQTWSVISGVGTVEQMQSAMNAVSEYLDTGMGLKKLSPGFKTYPDVKDPFSTYNPGNGENGAIFCHAHTWAIIAEAMLGNAKRAWKYYNDILPHNCIQRVGLETYKSEPYAWVSNIVGPENKKRGWGNVSHITGTAPWMVVAAQRYLLGIRSELEGLVIDPCVPNAWDKFSVSREYQGKRINITFENPNGANKGVTRLKIQDRFTDGNFIPKDLIIKSSKNIINIIAYM
ncbi:MAG: hypothetical protein K5768_03330 [Firmicutes bacterium]|nr:hypothetical protein [Bacillota bacterium]